MECNLFASQYYKYTVTKDGKVYSKINNEELNYYIRDGFYEVFFTLQDNYLTQKQWLRVDFLVAHTYLPNPNGWNFIKHLDGNNLNNKVDNLEWREFCVEGTCKVIPGYRDKYIITTDGKVFNNFTGIEMKQRTIQGYYHVGLRIFDGEKSKQKLYKVHRLVAEAFIPKIEGKDLVNHIDGNKLNNDVSNLEWVTPSENSTHAIRLNLVKTKFNYELGVHIIKLIEEYGYNYADIADITGIKRQTIAGFYQKGYKSYRLRTKNLHVKKHSNKKELPIYYKEYLQTLLKDNTVLI